MKNLTAILLAAAFLMALVFGAQTAEWSWGPAFVVLALALGAAAFVRGEIGGRAVWLSMLPVAGWVFYRAATSEVMDFARADALLVLAVLATATATAALRPGARSLAVLFGGLAVVSILNLSVAVVQSGSPGFTWPYHFRPSDQPTGFFGHYNYFSNYTLGTGLLLAARGLFCRDHTLLRLVFLATACGSAAMVTVSGSRGGTIALAVGILILTACAGVLAWRRDVWWAKLVMAAMPLLLVGAGVGGWLLFSDVLDKRGDRDVTQMADNSSRLLWMDLALRVASEHPLTGGGSRAYSWERNRHWKTEDFGRGGENERFVHNELLQMLTDYGAVGALLVLVPIGVVGWLALSRLFLGGDRGSGHLDAVAAGVLAAGAAVLTQANFSFVFHLLPSAMLLGLMLGLGVMLPAAKPDARRVWSIGVRAVLGVGLLWFGVQASRTLERVWPVLYAETSLVNRDADAAVGRLEEARELWSGHRMPEEAGHFSRLAASVAEIPEARAAWNRRAAENYRAAAALHPHHPGLRLNLANTLSELGETAAAGEAFQEAIRLQGGLEGAFEARYFFAKHLYEVWHRRWTDPRQRRASEALWAFRQARDLLDEAKEETGWVKAPQKDLHDQLGRVIDFLEGAKIKPVAPEEGISR